jgi:predicted nucleic acid-binding protein
MVALTLAAGRELRPRRLDLMIAATAKANDVALYTENAKDFSGLEGAVRIVSLASPDGVAAAQAD